ncbi:unnamed protein product [Choristocarpus tenellus]
MQATHLARSREIDVWELLHDAAPGADPRIRLPEESLRKILIKIGITFQDPPVTSTPGSVLSHSAVCSPDSEEGICNGDGDGTRCRSSPGASRLYMQRGHDDIDCGNAGIHVGAEKSVFADEVEPGMCDHQEPLSLQECDLCLRKLARGSASVRCRIEHGNRELERMLAEVNELLSPPAPEEEKTCRDTSSSVLPLRPPLTFGMPYLVASSLAATSNTSSSPGAQLWRLSPTERPSPHHPQLDPAGAIMVTLRNERRVTPNPGRATRVPGSSAKSMAQSTADTKANQTQSDHSLDGSRRCHGVSSSSPGLKLPLSAKEVQSAVSAAVKTALAAAAAEVQEFSRGERITAVEVKGESGLRGSNNSCSGGDVDGGSLGTSVGSHREESRWGGQVMEEEEEQGPTFDKPSVRNGLTRLTSCQVDELLLGVDDRDGTGRMWRGRFQGPKPEFGLGGKWTRDGALANYDTFVASRGRTRVESRTSANDHSVDMDRMKKVFRMPASGNIPPPERRNRWDAGKMKWVGPLEASARGTRNPVHKSNMLRIRPGVSSG